MKITKLEAEVTEYSDIALSCELGEYRYHIWLNRNTRKPNDTVLYKNTKVANGPGYQKTRKLSTEASSARTW